MQNKFKDFQNEVLIVANNIAKKIGADVWHRFEREGEFSIIYDVKLYVAAPCGCCDIEPAINIEDPKLFEKLKFLKEVHDITRTTIDEYSVMYGADYSGLYNYNKDVLFSKTVEEVAKAFYIEHHMTEEEQDERYDREQAERDRLWNEQHSTED